MSITSAAARSLIKPPSPRAHVPRIKSRSPSRYPSLFIRYTHCIGGAAHVVGIRYAARARLDLPAGRCWVEMGRECVREGFFFSSKGGDGYHFGDECGGRCSTAMVNGVQVRF